ncbi:helicase [Marmoricola endophyticus]|uniref:Helicase n=1 Tax=Marmoricola endophyticus TaxID=2040280 RepID=A0A917BCN7_9ACTN|nr:metal ABC transporter permease [Marmoricola endophyticus]GGF32077.1 helicase [Marmoricola endophyticus]
MSDVWGQLFDFRDYGALLPLVANSLLAGAVLGLVGGMVSSIVMMRDLPFAVHGISELSFAGATGALLIGAGVVAGALAGSVVAALLIGVLGASARSRSSIVGVLMPFGLGLGILFLSLYDGRAANKFGLLIGQIVSVDDPQLTAMLVSGAVVAVGMLVLWRPLVFASTDPEVAAARGVPVRALSIAFMVLLGLAVAISVQTIGALLVLSIICTPAAAAFRVSANPRVVVALSSAFGFTAMVGGILLATGSRLPITPYVTTLSFAIFVVCAGVGAWRQRHGWSRARALAPSSRVAEPATT